MDILKFYQDHNIDYRTEGHKHCRPGWVNIECPFCTGNPGYHLGFPLDGQVFVCYRCGNHSMVETISKLLGVSKSEAFKAIREYKGLSVSKSKIQVSLKKKPFILPSNLTELQANHKSYLRKRGFNPDFIQKHWQVQGTGPLSKVGKLDFRFRLFIPIYWKQELVSFQGRDITNKSEFRYLACPKEREKYHIKHTLYHHPDNWQNLIDQGQVIVTEGVTDVWKLGDSSVALYGIKYKRRQVIELGKNFKRIAIAFDPDPQAQEQAQQLQADLLEKGCDAWIEHIDQDPGSMTTDDANHLVKNVFKKIY